MDPDHFFDLNLQQHRNQRQPRKKKEYKARVDLRRDMTDREFKSHFRFSKESVDRITDVVRPDLEVPTNRGLPIPPYLQVCITLNHYAGAHFQRISGWCGSASQGTAQHCIVRVTNALVDRKGEYIHMPDVDEMAATAERMRARFKLPRFAFGVDGCQIRFEEAPRRIPANKTKQMFWCRKQFYSINAQVVANDKMMIYDLDAGWPGSTHDARVWRRSEVKRHIEDQQRFLVAGDSGYPISEHLAKPYAENEAGNDRRKRLFNRRLSGLRTVMTECVYGVWKRRFPILKAMRTHLDLSLKIIVASAVLHNMAKLWNDELDDEDDDSENEEETDEDDADDGPQIRGEGRDATRLRGKIARDFLKDSMPD